MAGEPVIAIWGHYHGGNLGDELVVTTIVDAIRRRMPNARIVGISMAPVDTRERHGIDAYPINPGTPTTAGERSTDHARVPTAKRGAGQARLRARVRRLPGVARLRRLERRLRAIVREMPFLWDSYTMLRSVDLLVVAGSGQLLDEWEGPWLHPYTTFRWAMLARLARVPTIFSSVGAGPIDGRLSAFFIRNAVEAARYVSVRDGHSGRVLTSIGCAGPFPVCPDIGYGLPDELLPAATARPTRGDGTVVGVNVMSHQDPRYWPHGDVERYEVFLAKMAEFTRWLLDNGHVVRLFSSQPGADGRVADDLIALLERSGSVEDRRLRSTLQETEQIDDLVTAITGCDFVVASRYHSVLLALLLDIPVVGLAYNAKTPELLAGVDHPERCLDIDLFSVKSLIRTFVDLQRPEDPDSRAALRARVARHREAVEEQFDRILAKGEQSRERELDSGPTVS